MLAFILLTLLNLAALYTVAVNKSLGIKWVTALSSLAFTLVGGWEWGAVLDANRNLRSMHFTGFDYIFWSYGMLVAVCAGLIINGTRKERSGVILLGLIVFSVAATLMWLAYELTYTSWKYGG